MKSGNIANYLRVAKKTLSHSTGSQHSAAALIDPVQCVAGTQSLSANERKKQEGTESSEVSGFSAQGSEELTASHQIEGPRAETAEKTYKRSQRHQPQQA